MNTTGGWKRRDYRRDCSVCGHPWKFSQMRYIGEGKWACPDDKSGLTAVQISRHNARARALKVRAVKHPRPDGYVDTYQLEEAQVFNAVVAAYPTTAAVLADSNVGRAGAYLANLIIENARPARWLTSARTVLARICDALLTTQAGSSTGIAMAATDIRYGGIGNPNYQVSNTALAGRCWALAYRALGTAEYLAAAERAMQFMRGVQCMDLSTGMYITYPSAGARYHTGGVVTTLSAAGAMTSVSDIQQSISTAGALLDFIAALSGLTGTSAQFGMASSSNFTSSTVATLQTMQNEVVSFLVTGAYSSVDGGSNVTGISTTTRATAYNPYASTGIGTGTWAVGTGYATIWALALAPLYAAGQTTFVNGIVDWLESFTSNPANQVPASGVTDAVLLAGNLGTYDPAICIATALDTASTIETTGAKYSWSWVGDMAPVLAARSSQRFEASKLAMSKPRRVSPTTIEYKYLTLQTTSGLAFQPHLAAGAVGTAARIANAYRYGKNHNPALQGNP